MGQARISHYVSAIVGSLCFLFIGVLGLWGLKAQSLPLEGIRYDVEEGREVGVHTGPLLPFEIDGVDNILPSWGAFVSHPSPVTQIEYSFLHGRANEAVYYMGSISFRVDFAAYKAVNGYLDFGLDAHHYKREPKKFQDYSFVSQGGVHAGYGFFVRLFGNMHLRHTLKLTVTPEKTMFVGAGLMYRWPRNEGP